MDENKLLRIEIEVRPTPFIEKRQVLILPRKMVREVVMGAHEQMAHRASLETYKKVRLYCYFPAMLKTVQEILKECTACQTKTTRLPDQIIHWSAQSQDIPGRY